MAERSNATVSRTVSFGTPRFESWSGRKPFQKIYNSQKLLICMKKETIRIIIIIIIILVILFLIFKLGNSANLITGLTTENETEEDIYKENNAVIPLLNYISKEKLIIYKDNLPFQIAK